MSLFASTFRVRDVRVSKVFTSVKSELLPDRSSTSGIGIDITAISPRNSQGSTLVGREQEPKWSAATLRVNTCPAASVSSRIN